MTSLDPYNNRDIPKFTLSLGLISPSNPSFSGESKAMKFYQTSVRKNAESKLLMHKFREEL